LKLAWRVTTAGLLVVIVLFVIGVRSVTEAASSGAKCTKTGMTQKTKGVTYVCKKTGSKLLWVTTTTKTDAALTPTTTTVATASSTTGTMTSISACKLPVADGRGDVSIGGWPRISERLKTTGTVVATVIMVDFPDAPAKISPQEAFARISGATDTFNEVSYGRLNYSFQPQYKWYRMSKSSTQYAPLNKSFLTHRDYILEATALADADINFGSTDSVIILSNPDASGIGNAGPAFSAVNRGGITLDGKYISNGATSAYDLNYWKSIWLNHEVTHTLGLVDVYAATTENSSNRYDGHRYVGEFSYMGLSSFDGNAPSLFAFERWNLGWLDDSQIVCSSEKAISQLIAPVQTTGGIKALILPLSRTKALVVESRRAIGLDSKIAKTGALVYTVDSSVQSGNGPVRVYPNSVSTDPRYLQAPRAVGESVTVEGITVTVTSSDLNGDTVSIKRP